MSSPDESKCAAVDEGVSTVGMAPAFGTMQTESLSDPAAYTKLVTEALAAGPCGWNAKVCMMPAVCTLVAPTLAPHALIAMLCLVMDRVEALGHGGAVLHHSSRR